MSENKIKKAPNDVTKLIPDFYEKFDKETGVYDDSIILIGKDLKELPAEFNQIKIINGDFILGYNGLTNASELNNLQYVGGDLDLSFNKLTNVSGFNQLGTIGGDLILGANKLTNLSGFNNLRIAERKLCLGNNKLSENDLLEIIKTKKNYRS